MPERKTIQEYLTAVEEQIRWKRARPVVTQELKRHLEDQRDAFAEEGEGQEEAERLAVAEMGDPVSVGTELDRIHRPRPQWGLLLLTALLALAGGILRVRLTAGWEEYGMAADPVRVWISVGLGTVCMLAVYFLDYSFLGRYAKEVYIAAVAAGLLTLWLSPRWKYTSYYTRYVALCYPAAYAVWLYVCRGKGWKGFILAIFGGVPLACINWLAPSVHGLLLLLFSGLILLLAAAGADWFGIGKGVSAAAPLGIAFAMAAGAAGMIADGYGKARISTLLHPELDPLGMGYQAIGVRKALSAAQWLGEGTWGPELSSYPYELRVPDWEHDFLLTTVIHKLGWLPFLLLMLAFTALVVWLLCRCLRQKSQLGRMVVLAVVLTMVFQAIFSVILNLGFVLCGATMPLLCGNLHTIIDMALIGLALSVFRGGSIVRESCLESTAPSMRKGRWPHWLAAPFRNI